MTRHAATIAMVAAFAAAAYAAEVKPAADVAGKPQARLTLGNPAPEIAATTMDGKPLGLDALRTADAAHPKFIVLQFGSITDPIFRAHTPAVENLAIKYADKAGFVLLYQQEAHAADSDSALTINNDEGYNIAQPTTLAERIKLAQQAMDRLKIIHQKILVDAWNNTSSLRYGSYPNMTFIIDTKGILQAGYPWMDMAKVQSALDTLIAGKPLPAELKGSIKLSASAPLDFAGAAMDMTGGRGPAGIAAVLDKMNLTEAQRAALYPALAEYLADIQAFRQTRAALPPPPGGRTALPRGPAARGALAPAAAPLVPGNRANATKPTTSEEVAASLEKLRTTAAKLKMLVKQNLPESSAAQLFIALEQTNQQRLFANP